MKIAALDPSAPFTYFNFCNNHPTYVTRDNKVARDGLNNNGVHIFKVEYYCVWKIPCAIRISITNNFEILFIKRKVSTII